jgi:hypothetical protein
MGTMNARSRSTLPQFHHTRMLMVADQIVSQVLMMTIPPAIVLLAATQADLLVTPPTMVSTLMMTLRIMRQLVSVQLLVVLHPWTGAEALRPRDWITTLATSDHELTQKMQMVLRYHNGEAMYLVFRLVPLFGCLSLAWVQL